MSNAHGLTKENLLFTFPAGLRENPSTAALGDVTMEALAKRPAEISRLSLYPRINELPEELLDILAYDFKVDWWDPEYSIEEKRRIFKDSWYVHKHMGTKAAVETAIRAIYPLTTVEEWFEYGGEPYHFKLHIDISKESGDKNKPLKVLSLVEYYKSLRSHLDVVEYLSVAEETEAALRITPVPGPCLTTSELPELEPDPVPPARVAITGALCLTIAETTLREREVIT